MWTGPLTAQFDRLEIEIGSPKRTLWIVGHMNTRIFCFEYRIGIEGEAAAIAARHRTAADLMRMQAAMTELEAVHRAENFSFEADFEFHLSVASATKNNFFLSNLEKMRSTIRNGMMLAIAPSTQKSSMKNDAIRAQHLEVFRAIERRDESGARDAMRLHLTRCSLSTRHWDESGDVLELEEKW